jgi:multicomponent Na+:H+ antiporter subunit E
VSDRVITFIVLFASWVVFSGQFDAFHLISGGVCALGVTLATGRMWFAGDSQSVGTRIRQGFGFAGFLIWLLGQIILANFYVVYLALHPRCNDMLRPHMVRFRTTLKGDFARFALANSITLTPGTITVEIEGDEFLVHAINEKTATDIHNDMELRLARIFEPESLTEAEAEA